MTNNLVVDCKQSIWKFRNMSYYKRICTVLVLARSKKFGKKQVHREVREEEDGGKHGKDQAEAQQKSAQCLDEFSSFVKSKTTDLMRIITTQYGFLDELASNNWLTCKQISLIRGRNSLIGEVRLLLGEITSETLPTWKEEAFLNALDRTQQKHVSNYIRSRGERADEHGDDWPVRYCNDYIAIIDNYPKLIELIDPKNGLLDDMFSAECINGRQKRFIEDMATDEKQNTVLIDCVYRGSISSYKAFIRCLQKTKQQLVVSLLAPGQTGDIRPLSEDQQSRLRMNYEALVDKIDSKGSLTDEMLTVDCITCLQKEYIEHTSTHSERNKRLLDIMLRGSETDYNKFVECLNKAGQDKLSSLLRVNNTEQQERQIVDALENLMRDDLDAVLNVFQRHKNRADTGNDDWTIVDKFVSWADDRDAEEQLSGSLDMQTRNSPVSDGIKPISHGRTGGMDDNSSPHSPQDDSITDTFTQDTSNDTPHMNIGNASSNKTATLEQAGSPQLNEFNNRLGVQCRPNDGGVSASGSISLNAITPDAAAYSSPPNKVEHEELPVNMKTAVCRLETQQGDDLFARLVVQLKDGVETQRTHDPGCLDFKTYVETQDFFEERIRPNYVTLLDLIDPQSGLLDEMLKINGITPRHKQEIDAKITKASKNELLLNYMRHGDILCQKFIHCLLKTEQFSVVYYLAPELPDGKNPVGLKRREELTFIKPQLLKLINPDTLLLHECVANGCITERQKYIIEASKVKPDRTSTLLDFIERGTEQGFNNFLSLLEEQHTLRSAKLRTIRAADDFDTSSDESLESLRNDNGRTDVGSVRPAEKMLTSISKLIIQHAQERTVPSKQVASVRTINMFDVRILLIVVIAFLFIIMILVIYLAMKLKITVA